MNPKMADSKLSRIAFYAAIAVLVLAYVGLTSQEGVIVTTARQDTTADSHQEIKTNVPKLFRRMGLAAAATALWIILDAVILIRLVNRDVMTFYLVRVLLGWGALLALGAMLSPGNQRLLAAAIVFGVTAAFVGLWIAALAARRAKMPDEPIS